MPRGYITRVHHKGFAFARTSEGDVFIPPKTHEALGCPSSGSQVELTVTRGPKGLVAHVPVSSSMEWDTWQVGAGSIKLPNTAALSKHTITFGCFQCGSEILADDDVYKIKNAAIWTNDLPSSLKEGKQFFNRQKNVHGYSAHCRKCNFNMGTIYREPYEDAAPELGFPCAKLTYVRERRSDDTLLHGLVVLAESKKEAEIALSRLVLNDDGATKSNVRVTSHTWELMQQLDKEKETTRILEVQADEAVTRELQVLSVLDKQEHEKALAYKSYYKKAKNARKAFAESQTERDRASEKLQVVQAERSSVKKKLIELQKVRATEQDMTIFVTAQKESLAVTVQDLTKQMQGLSADRDILQTTIRQKDVEINDKKVQLLRHERTLANLVRATAPSTSKQWSSAGMHLQDGTLKHEIDREDLQSGADTREQDEFNFASGQMQRLQPDGDATNSRVRKVVVYENPFVTALYASKQSAMIQTGPCRELWVFHGTAEQNIEAIMSEGFKVGGNGTIEIRNGAVHGKGVYTATGPNTPVRYSNQAGGNAVILSKALEGTKGRQELGDCWAPIRDQDWLVFKSGEQLLPKYAVYW
jgi:hypothetical protein